MKKYLLFLSLLLSLPFFSRAQNLLDTSTWTIGSGSVSGFSQNGSTSENAREYGTDPFGNTSILWKGGNDASYNADGGWNTTYQYINHTDTYRFVVWLKKTNSNYGSSYFGCQQWVSSSDTTVYNHTIRTLDGFFTNNPYFWIGDLPQLNKWYMLVGFVHGSNYNSEISYGAIYDPSTGERVRDNTDFKFATTTTKLRHRTYLYYDGNTADRQYFWAPRVDKVDGSEPSILDLLHVNENSTLIFSHDIAGNQKQRFYCEEEGFCGPSAPTSRIAFGSSSSMQQAEEEDVETTDEPVDEKITIDTSYHIYPNPTSGQITIQLTGSSFMLTNSVGIYNASGSLIRKIPIPQPINQMQIDMNSLPSGIYFVHLHFTNGTIATEKINKL